MAAKDDLAFIAQRIRNLADSQPKDDLFLTAVWRLVRKATDIGAFAEVHFTEFKTSFDSQRESETYNSRNRHGVMSAPINRLPLTMLEAMKWLAETDIGLSIPADLPKLGDFESHSLVIRRGGGGIESHIQYPSRDTLRPHVEFLASLIEAAGQGGNMGKMSSSNRKSNSANDATKLRPCDKKAFSQYEHAIEQEPSIESDDEAYDWLVEDLREDGIALTRRDNWKRYVGRARTHYGKQKNGPRIGNETHSVVSAKRLDTPKRTKSDQR
ncbi:MAG: hypothetical protein ACKV2Q_20525 [Planctomycetaceae bacterium]